MEAVDSDKFSLFKTCNVTQQKNTFEMLFSEGVFLCAEYTFPISKEKISKRCKILHSCLFSIMNAHRSFKPPERRVCMTDSELLALIDSSPAQGHRALYDAYVKYVYAIIFHILRDCGSAEDVEDCLVETFTDVIEHIDNINGSYLKAYIGQSARNRAMNYYHMLKRHKQNTVAIDSVPEPSVKHVQEQLERKEMQERLLQSIHALGEPDATILIQKYYYGRKMAAIGKMVGLTANAAQVRCSRALKRLQKELADWRD